MTEKFTLVIFCIVTNAILIKYYIFSKNKKYILISAISIIAVSGYMILNTIKISYNYLREIIFIVAIVIVPGIASASLQTNINILDVISCIKVRINMYLGEYLTAIKILSTMTKSTAKSEETLGKYYYLIGMCYLKMKDFVNSRDNLYLAIKLNNKLYKAYYEIGSILDESNKKEEAIVMFNNCLRIKPDYYEALESLGISFTSKGKYEEAIGVYTNALKYYPKSYVICYNLGMVLMEIGKYKEAEESFLKAAKIKSKFYSAYYNIGTINYLKGDYDRAIEFFKLARSSTLYGAKAYYKLATLYSSEKDYERAMSFLEYAIQIDYKYLEEAKIAIVFENMRDKIFSYEEDLKRLNEKNKKYAKNYVKGLENSSKEKSRLDNIIEDEKNKSSKKEEKEKTSVA